MGKHHETNRPTRIDFAGINAIAQSCAPALIHNWLPHGRRVGDEWVCLNPNRGDKQLGSFKVNMRSGNWADFATGDRGRDLISLVAYLDHCSQSDAARSLANKMGVRHEL